jgi:hypothetical protein
MSGKSPAIFHHRAMGKTPMILPTPGTPAIAGNAPDSPSKLHRRAAALDRLRAAAVGKAIRLDWNSVAGDSRSMIGAVSSHARRCDWSS